MSLDRRLRDELQREAEGIDPDVGRGLIVVETRVRRRSTAGLGTLLAAAAAVVLLVVGVASAGVHSPRNRTGRIGVADWAPLDIGEDH